MDKRGFTLVELIATIVVLGLIASVVLVSVNGGFGNAKNKSEDIFVETIKDALDVYINSVDLKEDAVFNMSCNSMDKTHGVVQVKKAVVSFDDIINSEYKPLIQSDLINPANKEVKCSLASNIPVTIYRSDDYVYYYSIDKNDFDCFIDNGIISNLPDGYEC